MAIILDDFLIFNIEDGGNYRIGGQVSELGIYGIYLIRLFDRNSGRCIQATQSNPNGEYAFDNIKYILNGYFVIAFDHGNNPLNAAIADLITPEPMP